MKITKASMEVAGITSEAQEVDFNSYSKEYGEIVIGDNLYTSEKVYGQELDLDKTYKVEQEILSNKTSWLKFSNDILDKNLYEVESIVGDSLQKLILKEV